MAWLAFGGIMLLVVAAAYRLAFKGDDPEDAYCEIRVHNSGAEQGECWYTDGFSGDVKQNDVVVPEGNITNYQMKWESLSGNDPDVSTVAASTWHPLSTSDFAVAWEATEIGDSIGSITVSIREGVGVTLDTAVWDGEAIVEEGG